MVKSGGASQQSRCLTLQDGGADSALLQLSANLGPRGLPDSVYVLAAAVFHKAHAEQEANHTVLRYYRGTGQPLPKVKNEEAQRWAYELAFNTLTYYEVLEDVMTDSCFNRSQPVPDNLISLVMVMLYDLQDRKFLPRKQISFEGDEEMVEVREVESSLYRSRTRLAASLARCRIKRSLLCIDDFLPEPVRMRKARANALPLYAWVNRLKCSLRDVCSILERGGFSQVKSIRLLEGPMFCQDARCQDLLAFRPPLKADLYSTRLFCDHKLLVQDKGRYLAVSCLHPLLAQGCHVLLAGYFSVSTVAQVAVMASSHSAQVRVCWLGRTPSQREELLDTLVNMGCRNVKLISESFLELDPSEPWLQKVQVILLMPLCSASAVSNVVEFLLAEGREVDLLHDLSKESFSQSRLDILVARQMCDVTHAMKCKFQWVPKVRAVLYSTCSVNREENEEVVESTLEQVGSKHRMFRLQPAVLSQFSILEMGKAKYPFLQVDPSEDTNGCFVALLSRELDRQEAVQEVLVRAAAKGLLSGIQTNPSLQKEKRKKSRKSTLADSMGQFKASKQWPAVQK